MEPQNRTQPVVHLTDDALFVWPFPQRGVPECTPRAPPPVRAPARALLADWKNRCRTCGSKGRRPAGEARRRWWIEVEEATLAAIRGRALRARRARTLRWALPVAASLLVFALPRDHEENPAHAPEPPEDTAGLSTQDRADDALLRDVDSLASGDDTSGGWGALAPEPGAPDPAAPEEGRS